MDKEFQEIKAQFEKFNSKFKKIQADITSEDPKWKAVCDIMNHMQNNIYASINYLHDRIDRTNANHIEHTKNHMPPVKTPTQMQKILSIMGAEDDYDIQKPTISMGKTNKGLILEATYAKKNERI